MGKSRIVEENFVVINNIKVTPSDMQLVPTKMGGNHWEANGINLSDQNIPYSMIKEALAINDTKDRIVTAKPKALTLRPRK